MSPSAAMFIDRVWATARRFTPIRLYPLLAPLGRWRRRIQVRQLEEDDRRYLAEHPGLDVPNVTLRYNVAGPCTIPWFIRSGEQAVDEMQAALKTAGTSLATVRDFLDFGCGCGRVTRPLTNRGFDLRITGCDVDARAIDWCRQHLRGARFIVTSPLPPLPFEDGGFDLVWCGSVFTHLDEQRQDRWLAEIRRILRPGGLLVASVHGPSAWEGRIPPWAAARLKRRGMIFATTRLDAGNHPEWYQVAWHTEQYVRRRWGSHLEIRSYVTQARNNLQDIVVAQKRG